MCSSCFSTIKKQEISVHESRLRQLYKDFRIYTAVESSLLSSHASQHEFKSQFPLHLQCQFALVSVATLSTNPNYMQCKKQYAGINNSAASALVLLVWNTSIEHLDRIILFLFFFRVRVIRGLRLNWIRRIAALFFFPVRVNWGLHLDWIRRIAV